MPALVLWPYSNISLAACHARHPSYLIHDAIRPLAYLLDLFILRKHPIYEISHHIQISSKPYYTLCQAYAGKTRHKMPLSGPCWP